MNDSERLRERVNSFPRWHYEFDLNGVRTPIFNRAHVNRNTQRKNYFFAPLVRLCGGSLVGKRVLDLGCNAGFWSLAAIEAGADFVLGIDGRQMHIDQANLVFDAKGVDPNRYRFQLCDIFRQKRQCRGAWGSAQGCVSAPLKRKEVRSNSRVRSSP
jgi:2-polyprenyl-3-methyl-5-hydroxy-6-metoxy-1,4-benzoquinol methylase